MQRLEDIYKKQFQDPTRKSSYCLEMRAVVLGGCEATLASQEEDSWVIVIKLLQLPGRQLL